MRGRLWTLGLALAALASAEEPVIRAGPERVRLIELYTSQGCRSCPPAEAWLGGLQKFNQELWRDWVPVAFHVDYWNHLGWTDPFSRSLFTERQRSYAAGWRDRTVYTPCLVLQGETWQGWRRQARPPAGSTFHAGNLEARREHDGAWKIYYGPREGVVELEAHAALLGCGLVTDVTAGENEGRSLTGDFVAMGYAVEVMADEAEGKAAVLRLPDPEKILAPRRALAVWITVRGSPQPIQAAGGWLDGVEPGGT